MPKSHYREPERLTNLAGGLNDSRHPTAIAANETPDCENVEFDRDSVHSSGGCLKFNNQVAPRSAVRTSVDPGFSPLSTSINSSDSSLRSVPLRNYVFFPYSEKSDIGGLFKSEGTFPSGRYHTARGRSFEIKVSFKVPEDVDLLPGFHFGDGASQTSGNDSLRANYGANEALDDCVCILQKGGDRTSPMSWALAIVNTGAAPKNSSNAGSRSPFYWLADLYGEANPPKELPRQSPYALCFMWLDSPAWGQDSADDFAYRLDNGTVYDGGLDGSAVAGSQALRSIVCEKFIEPGRTYHVAVQLELDSGSVVDASDVISTDWNNDGAVRFQVVEDYNNLETFEWAPGMNNGGGGVWVNKGPADSLEYLVKYGVRYQGKDAMFGGLGYRQASLGDQGYIPYGMDSAPMEHGGHRLVDRSVLTAEQLYGSGAYGFTFNYTGTDEIECDQAGLLAAGVTTSPLGWTGIWAGYGALSSILNAEALNGYRLIFTSDSSAANAVLPGGVMTISGSTHNSSNVQFQVHNPTGASAFSGSFSSQPYCLIQAFRWNQRDLVIGDVRVYSAPRDYADDRVEFSLRSTVELDDPTEPDLDTLASYWPMDDAGGGTVRELVGGNDAYLAPFGLGVSDRGTRGRKSLFLSGEGEAIELDLSDNPVFGREFQQLLRTGKAGFAIELTVTMPEAIYGKSVTHATESGRRVGSYAPCLASWDVRAPDESGHHTSPKPLMQLTHRAIWTSASGANPTRAPMMFQALCSYGADNSGDPLLPVNGVHNTTDGFTFDTDAPWVGNAVTIQIGVHPTGTEDQFHVYLAGKPVGLISTASAGVSPAQGEIQYFGQEQNLGTSPTAVTISKKDLLRSVVTIGGCADPTGLGYSEVRARMIVDEVRVFASAAPGAIGTSNGSPLVDDNGKLSAGRGLPLRELSASDLLQAISPNSKVANVVEGSQTVTASSNQAFSTVDSAEDSEGIQGTYLLVNGDEFVRSGGRDAPTRQEEFYGIRSVASGGASLATVTPIRTATATSVTAYSFRVVGYTAFGDGISRKPIALGGGVPFKPGTTKASDAVVVPNLFFNRAPVTGNFGLSIFSPVAGGSIAGVARMWTRGLSAPRANRILGLKNLNENVYASARGALFNVDDRWRDEGPTDDLNSSLDFLPGQKDYVAWKVSRNADFIYGPGTNNKVWQFDAWVYLESVEGTQTIAWHGSVEHGLDVAGGSASDTENDRKLRWFWRINNGRQEFGIGSPQSYSGGSGPPEHGQYIASDKETVPAGEWVHLRVEIEFVLGDANYPRFFIHGKRRPGDSPWDAVTVNASTNASPSANPWIDSVTTGQYTPETDRQFQLWLGASRGMEELFPDNPTFLIDELGGRIIRRGNRMGVVDGLVGRLAGVAVVRRDLSSGSGANYDPFAIDYSVPEYDVRFRADLQEGVGHLCFDAGDSLATNAQTGIGASAVGLGVVMSHPFISMKHDMGASEEQTSMAVHNQRIFVANGGRPAFIGDAEGARFCGLLPPTSKLVADIIRKPILARNTPRVGDADYVAGSFVTPLQDADVSADQADQRYHFDNPGTWFLRQTYHKEMAWEFPDGGSRDIFAFKCYFMLRNTHGRIPLYSQRRGVDAGGPFVEVRDGKVVFGWFDLDLKKEVSISTNVPVVRAGYWNYLYVRKRWPERDADEGNWINSVYLDDAAGECKDLFVVRELDQELATDVKRPWWSHKAGGRMAVSFTTSDYRDGDMPNIPATGMVSLKSSAGITFSGNASGVITPSSQYFHPDHVGMLFWFDPDDVTSGFEQPYVITGWTDASPDTVTVKALDGSTPDLSSLSGDGGAVFSGVSLVKSPDFDNASRPDPGPYDIELFGSQLARDPATGITPFDGKFDSFAYHVTSLSANTVIFEAAAGDPPLDDALEMGSDDLNALMSSATAPGPLRTAGGSCFASVHTNTYAAGGSEQDVTAKVLPNKELEVALSTESSVNALPLRVEYIRQPTLFRARRLVRVAFHDPTLGLTSFPGPPLTVVPEAEDVNNPAGDVRLLLRRLPISVDGEQVQRRVYLTQPGGSAFFLQKIIPDNESTSVELRLTDDPLALGEALRFDNLDPPDCHVVASSQGAMFYGRIAGDREQPDGIAYSQFASPFSVPPTNLVVINAGGADAIRAMRGHRGKLIVYKGDYVAKIVVRGAVALVEEVTNSVGCSAHQTAESLDDRLYSLAARGPYVYTGAGTPAWIAHSVDAFFNGTGLVSVDARELNRASAAINKRRNQYVMALQAAGEESPQVRITTEYDNALSGVSTGRKMPALHRFGRLRHPNVTALGVVNPVGGGTERLIGGTEEGFVVWLDRSDTRRIMIGGDSSIWGVTAPGSSGVVVGNSYISIGGTSIDKQLEGIRGCPVYWGQNSYGTALFATNSAIHLTAPVKMASEPSPPVRIGPRVAYWETGWLDLGRIENSKSFRYLDFVHAISNGSVKVQAFLDMDDATDLLDCTHRLDSGSGQYGYASLDINQLKGRRVKFRFYLDYAAADVDLELVEIALRGQDADVR